MSKELNKIRNLAEQAYEMALDTEAIKLAECVLKIVNYLSARERDEQTERLEKAERLCR